MNILYLLVLVVAEASVLKSQNQLQRPQITHLIGSFPCVTIAWNPVPSPSLNPVRGYKAKIWEQQKRLVGSLELVDGVYVWVEREELAPFTGDIPDWEPKEEITVRGSSDNKAQFRNLERGIMYEIRVQAFTLNQHGPLSTASRVDFI